MAFLKKISKQSASDAELINLYKQTRDLNILAELFQRYMDLIYGVCLKYLKEPESAQDSVMMIFEELTAKLLKHEVDNFKSWLYTLCKNHCLMQLRSEKKYASVKLDDELVQLEENVHLNGVLERETNLKQLEGCMQQLVPEQRMVIELFYLRNKCYNEITLITGLEWNKVRSFIQNGRRNLKLCMEKTQEKTIV